MQQRSAWQRWMRWQPRPLVAVVRLGGIIGPSGGPVRPTLNLASIAFLLDRAFRLRGVRAVALAINSPGGSPVQSALLHDRIRQLSEERSLPVYAFCEDVAASGGYWLACAGDSIYANANSVVGSIGVISGGFGFDRLIERIGVERRLYTAGERKSFMDPFRAENPDDVRRLQALQGEIHEQFKAHVRARRGDRLKAEESELFSGEFWTGETALRLGLIDGIGDLRQVMRERFGEKVRFRLLQPSRGWLQRRMGLDRGEGWDSAESFADGLLATLERRALWSRYGL